MNITRTTYFSLSGDDVPGSLASLTAQLMESEVNLEGLWGFGIGQGKAQFIVVPEEPELFKVTAAKLAWVYKQGICFRLEDQDRRGVLVETLNKIKKEGINLHAVDAISLDDQVGCYIWTDEDQVERLGKVLRA